MTTEGSDSTEQVQGPNRQRSLLARIIRRLVVLGVIAFSSMYLLAVMAETPKLGVQQNGQLTSCPDSPNCVSTFASDPEHAIEPIAFEVSPAEVIDVIQAVLKSHPRTVVTESAASYIRAECTSLIFRFTDDIEFLVDGKNKLIHFRSASRVGYSDMGANRKRMKKLTEKITEKLKELPTDEADPT